MIGKLWHKDKGKSLDFSYEIMVTKSMYIKRNIFHYKLSFFVKIKIVSQKS